jgi:pimeloyl-ACP methyl ester carboxylesterase
MLATNQRRPAAPPSDRARGLALDSTVQRRLEGLRGGAPIPWTPRKAVHQIHVPEEGPLKVSYRSWGPKGTPTAVLVHGWGESSGTWRFVGPLLGSQAPVVAPDLPGFGESACPKALLDIETGFLEAQAGFLLQSLEALGLDIEETDLVGHSMGATIVLEAIRQAGASPRSLCLMAPLEYGVQEVPFSAKPFVSYPTWLLEAGARLGLGHFLLIQQMLRLVQNPQQLTREYVDELAGFLRRSTAIRVLERGVMASIDRTEAGAPNADWVQRKRSIYPRLDCPTSLLWGSADRLISPAFAAPIKSAVPRLESFDIADAGHILQLDAPGLVSDLVLQTWSRAEGSRPARGDASRAGP